MARDRRMPTESEIPWWGYFVVALAIVVVIVIGVFVWHLIALIPSPYAQISPLHSQ